ncbi:hypothetical protein Cgig2_034129 [Carnegiea gigantea]|uniref:NAD(P)H-quinone oxidoreductase subunit 2 N-terminal domain-containing protein n=1 Tax=Carnegiea gigantea TaxID=171969 RepID=A0A9Q1QIV7_9CARY|nr:hypothetical protein Cgig2_034129 [Carnegiea gigantea]
MSYITIFILPQHCILFSISNIPPNGIIRLALHTNTTPTIVNTEQQHEIHFDLILHLRIDSNSARKYIIWLYFISSTSLLISITLLFRWRADPMISFSEISKHTISMKIFQFLILICSTVCLPLAIECIECTEMALTEFFLYSYILSGYTKKDAQSNELIMKYLLMCEASFSILLGERLSFKKQ